MRAFVGAALFFVLCFADCEANPLDDCTIQSMVGVNSDTSAKFVRAACIGAISSPIPRNELSLPATANIGRGQSPNENDLYVNIENNSNYAITELLVIVTMDKNSKSNVYEVKNFIPIYTDPGVAVGPPPDPAAYLQIPPYSTVYFSFPIHEQVPKGKWTWEIVSAMGYRATDKYSPNANDGPATAMSNKGGSGDFLKDFQGSPSPGTAQPAAMPSPSIAVKGNGDSVIPRVLWTASFFAIRKRNVNSSLGASP